MQVHEHIYPNLLSCDLGSSTLLTFVLAQSAERAVESKQLVPSESDYSKTEMIPLLMTNTTRSLVGVIYQIHERRLPKT